MPTTNFLTLPDKRQLAYAEYGDSNGHPVLYFHGLISSRLDLSTLGDKIINKFGLRMIALDRPGVGQSDFQPNRGFSDWANDVVFFADALNLDKFSVLGVSGGCGYVAACAAKIPERIYAAVIVSGGWKVDLNEDFSTINRLVWFLAKRLPLLHLGYLKLIQQSLKGNPEELFLKYKKQFPQADYLVLGQPDRMKPFCETTIEAMCRGVKGVAYDMRLYTREWDFGLDEIQIPLIMFHGEQDTSVPISSVKKAVANLPTAKLTIYPEEGHISVIVNQFETIAKSLVNNI